MCSFRVSRKGLFFLCCFVFLELFVLHLGKGCCQHSRWVSWMEPKHTIMQRLASACKQSRSKDEPWEFPLDFPANRVWFVVWEFIYHSWNDWVDGYLGSSQARRVPLTGSSQRPLSTSTDKPWFSPPLGEREPGEGERCPEEGGEEAERGGQVPGNCAEQPRASVHGPGPPEPRTPVPSSPRQLPPAHHPTTLPALSCQTTERRQGAR